MPRIHLTGIFTTPADRLAQVLALLPDHIRLTRAEPGCLSFAVTQSAADPCCFHVAEIFANRAAFDAHQARAAASDWAIGTAGMSRDYKITQTD